MKLFKKTIFLGLMVSSFYGYAGCDYIGVIDRINLSNISNENARVNFTLDRTIDNPNKAGYYQIQYAKFYVENSQMLDILLKARVLNKPVKVSLPDNSCSYVQNTQQSSWTFVEPYDSNGDAILNKEISAIVILDDFYPQ